MIEEFIQPGSRILIVATCGMLTTRRLGVGG